MCVDIDFFFCNHCTVPSEQHAGLALSALIQALHELEMVAIVRYAYDRRSNPQVGAAFPCIKPHSMVRWLTPKHAALLTERVSD